MSNESEVIKTRGYLLVYDFYSLYDESIKWNNKKTTIKEEDNLFQLKSEINKLIGYVCSCKISSFSKNKYTNKEFVIKKDEVNDPEYVAIFINSEIETFDTFIIFNEKKIKVERSLLIIIDSTMHNKFFVKGSIDFLSLSIHKYAL